MNMGSKHALYVIVVMLMFFLGLGVVDYWVFRWSQGAQSLFNYWIAVGFTFFAFGVCLATVMYVANPKLNPKILLGVAVTPFSLLVAGVWDWVIYLVFLRYGAEYSYLGWSAQERWFGTWSQELQLLWTLFCLAIITFMWLKILGKKVKIL